MPRFDGKVVVTGADIGAAIAEQFAEPHSDVRWNGGTLGLYISVLLLLAVPCSSGEPDEDPVPCGAQLELHRTGVIRRLRPVWSAESDGDPELQWLLALQNDPAVISELAALAQEDEVSSNSSLPASVDPGAFAVNHDPSHISRAGAEDWSALPLMNKGNLLPNGCGAAPKTCKVLDKLKPFLVPRPPASTEVGVRLLKLNAGAKLRNHYGPGGRLVAHLGIRVPDGATMTLAGDTERWHDGELRVFDDAYLHSAENTADRPRYILHIAFPHPDLLNPAPDRRSPAAAATALPIATTGTPHFTLDIFADCSCVVTNLRNKIQSAKQPLVKLYNKVADNQDSDWDACVSAVALPTTAAAGNSSSSVRVTAAHGYGSLDIGLTAEENWVTLGLLRLDKWTADPAQRHLKFALMCPQDICCASPEIYSPNIKAGVIGASVNGLFQGWRGAEGHYPDSSGFLTISSDWQQANEMYFAQVGMYLFIFSPGTVLSLIEILQTQPKLNCT